MNVSLYNEDELMNERDAASKHTFSVQAIYHFTCCKCCQRWSIADFDLKLCKRKLSNNVIVAFCPVCNHCAELIPSMPVDHLLFPRKFLPGDRVRKKSGAKWQGHVCGWYSTEMTPDGYAVESEFHKNSVQIYPAGALELVSVDDGAS